MAEIDGTFPFNQLGLARPERIGDEDTGALSNLRRARDEREARRRETERPREATDRVDLGGAGNAIDPVRRAEEAALREAQTANAPGRTPQETETGTGPRTLSAIQQAVAAVVRPPQLLQAEPPELQPNIIEPGVEGPVGQLQLAPEQPAPNPLTPPPPQPEEAQAPPAPGNQPPLPGQPEPTSNVDQLERNPGALRRNFLETDPALRANRELRRFLAEPGERGTEETPPPAVETNNRLLIPQEPFAPPEAQPETLTSRVAESVSPERVGPDRTGQAEAANRTERERRGDATREPPPPPTPEALVTERGLNINEFI